MAKGPSYINLKSAQDEEDDADDQDHNTGDTDGYVDDDSGFAGDATSRTDSPEDVALHGGQLGKRGIPDEGGRTDASAMKQFRLMTKRDFDANVGGGVDRDKLPAGDFVFPKERSFPIVTAGDVSDAVSSWGRYKGSESFATFKRNLTRIATRKGFGGSLPDAWKSGSDGGSDNVASKAWVNLEGSYEDTIADLGEAVDRMVDSIFPDMAVTSWIAGTYADKAIVGLCLDDEPGDCHVEYWEVPYAIDNSDLVTISQPKALDIQGVAVDRPEDASEGINFLSPFAVAVKGLQRKNATRLWRRYSLLINRGEGAQVAAAGLTPQMLRMAPEGLSNIPGAGDADYRTGQMDLTQPGGAEPNIPNNTAMGSYDSYNAGNMASPPLPAFYQGVWYVDNAGNLTSSPVHLANDDAGMHSVGVGMSGGPVDSSLYTGNDVGNMDSPPLPGIRGTTLDAGTLSFRGLAPGETKNETRILRTRRLLDMFNDRLPDGDEPLSDSTSEKMLDILSLVSGAFTELKEGRVLSGANAGRVQDAHAATGAALDAHAKLAAAHSALGEMLQQAGVKPGWQEPTNETPGMDEEGVPIQQTTAPNDTKGFFDDFREWQALQQKSDAQAA